MERAYAGSVAHEETNNPDRSVRNEAYEREARMATVIPRLSDVSIDPGCGSFSLRAELGYVDSTRIGAKPSQGQVSWAELHGTCHAQ